MGLVANDEIPFRRGLELCFEFVGACRHVEPHDEAAAVDEGVARHRGLDDIPCQQIEGEAELLCQLVLPLLNEAARRHDEAALEVAADHQLLDEEPRHDGLAGPGVVREQVAERLARQHLPINCRDLVRQGLDLRRADGEIGIEEMREADAKGFRREAEEPAIGVETIAASGFGERQGRLVTAVEQALADATVGAERDVDRVGSEVGDLNYLGIRADLETADFRSRSNLIEVHRFIQSASDGSGPVNVTICRLAWTFTPKLQQTGAFLVPLSRAHVGGTLPVRLRPRAPPSVIPPRSPCVGTVPRRQPS